MFHSVIIYKDAYFLGFHGYSLSKEAHLEIDRHLLIVIRNVVK